MGILKLANNATSLLAANISSGATALAITSGDEGKFPSLGAGEFFPVTVVDGAGNREVMRVTARSGVNLTVTRAQEGTTALAFTSGARVDLRLTQGSLFEHFTDIGNMITGIIANLRLPVRLRETSTAVADCDAVAVNGFHCTDAATTGSPIAATAGFLWHQTISSNVMLQEWQAAATVARYTRKKVGGTWEAWKRIDIEARGVPPGSTTGYAGETEPPGWLFCYGQAISRTTYADLFAAIAPAIGTCTVTIASPCVVTKTAHAMKPGDKCSLETTGSLPTGLAVGTNLFVSATGFTANSFQVSTSKGGASVNTSGSQSGTHTLRKNAHGCGNGSTTFNVPDRRGRAGVGRDDMGGTSADRLTGQTGGIDGDVLGDVGGSETHQLTATQNGQHNHGVTDPGHAHSISDPGHAHFAGDAVLSSGAGGSGLRAYTGVGGSGATTASGTGIGIVAAATGIAIQNSGTGAAHNNVPPSLVENVIIKT